MVNYDAGSLTVGAAACLIPIGTTIDIAVGNVEGSLSASLSIFGVVGI